MNKEKLVLAAMSGLRAVGPKRLHWLLSHGSSPMKSFEKLINGKLNFSDSPRGVTSDLIRTWRQTAKKIDMNKIQKRLESESVEIICESDDLWPFKNDIEPPAVVFAKGNLSLLSNTNSIGIVGTRRCSSLGKRVAFEFGRDFGAANVNVVSGLAHGIDGAAHKGALTSCGPTIAIVGGGLDYIYPKSNTKLWELIAQSGLILSESPLGARPEKWRFPARNRLIAALSKALVVVESHESGGSLITVDECLERDKPVFAVPGSVLSPASKGTNRLISDGAVPALCSTELLSDLFQISENPKAQNNTTKNLDPLSQKIINMCKSSEYHFDVLANELGLATHILLSKITELSHLGHILWDGSTVSISN